jgi:response regulator RpfG family c-di-GMP phosphodiesterase
LRDNDDLFFLDEDENASSTKVTHKPWKVLIADDEDEIHRMTKLVLGEYRFEDKGLEFFSTYSAEESKKILREHHDIAMAFIDVVMENDTAGLKLIEWIRKDLKNTMIRIVLRTGQPGTAPEKSVIMDYDINDYKEKTELTETKLFSAITSSLRSFRDLTTIDKSRKGLEQIVKASGHMIEEHSLKLFAKGVLMQLAALLRLDEDMIYLHISGMAAREDNGEYIILAGTGEFQEYENKSLNQLVNNEIMELFSLAISEKKSIFKDSYFLGYFQSEAGGDNILFINGGKPLDEIDQELFQIISTNISAALENIYLTEEMEETQKEIINTLSEVVEQRSHEISYHVQRVSEYAELLALKYGLSKGKATILKLAAPLHDLGKIGIPDSILLKKGLLSPDEFNNIRNHVNIGHNILKTSKRPILRAAAIINLEHHERWDGKGYPHGLKGQDIHIFGRIIMVADVYDALLSKRPYKEAWKIEKVLDFFKNERGKAFDPDIVDILMDSSSDLKEIYERYLI